MRKACGNTIKWAVFQGSTGLYAMRLVENLQEAEGLHNKFILENDPGRMPILVNFSGGFISFDRHDSRLIEIKRLSDGEPPLTLEEMHPTNSHNFKYGWISPEGITYSCDYEFHTRCAGAICRHLCPDSHPISPVQKLLDIGWAQVLRGTRDSRVYDDSYKNVCVFTNNCLSKPQADILMVLGLDKENRQIRQLIEWSEKYW